MSASCNLYYNKLPDFVQRKINLVYNPYFDLPDEDLKKQKEKIPGNYHVIPISRMLKNDYYLFNEFLKKETSFEEI